MKYQPIFSDFRAKVQWFVNNFLARPYFWLFTGGVKIINRDKIPDWKQNYIIVSNHLSYKEPVLFYVALGHRISCVAKKELFDTPIMGPYLRMISTIPVDRQNFKSSTIKLARKLLSQPFWKLGIFIEGTRSKVKGQLSQPFSGVMFIAKVSKVPILPLGIKYEGKKPIITVGDLYYPDASQSLDEQTWDCLQKISDLSGLKMPPQYE